MVNARPPHATNPVTMRVGQERSLWIWIALGLAFAACGAAPGFAREPAAPPVVAAPAAP